MDIMRLLAEVSGLSTFIFCGVAQLKRFGISGTWLEVSSYAFGLVFGGLYRYFTYAPATAVDWFWLVLFGMGGGFIATSVYKGVESATGGAVVKETYRDVSG
jgi:hypothetical protein